MYSAKTSFINEFVLLKCPYVECLFSLYNGLGFDLIDH